MNNISLHRIRSLYRILPALPVRHILLLALLCLCHSTEVWSQRSNSSEIDSLITEARALQAVGDADTSLGILRNALEKCCRQDIITVEQWARIVNLQAVSYSMKFDWVKAIKTSYDVYRQTRAESRSEEHARSLYYLSLFHAGRGIENDYDVAIKYAEEARGKLNKRSMEYFDCLNNLTYFYMLDNNTEKAADLMRDVINTGEKVFGNNKRDFIKALWNKTTDIAELEIYRFAVTYGNETLTLMENNGLDKSTDYLRRLVHVAGYYYQMRDFEKEITVLEKAVPASKEIAGEESKEYVDCLRKLALAYNHLANEIRAKSKKGEYEHMRDQAERLEGEARQILLKTGRLAEIRSYQIPLIVNQAFDLFNEKNYPEAIRYEHIAYQLYEMNGDSIGMARSANNEGHYQYINGSLENARKCNDISTTLYDKLNIPSRNMGLAFNYKATYCHDVKDLKGAAANIEKAVRVFEESGDTSSKLYLKTLDNAAVYCHDAGNDTKANRYGELAQSIRASQDADAQARREAQLAKVRRKKKRAALAQTQAEEIKKEQMEKIDDNAVTTLWNKAMYTNSDSALHSAYRGAIELQLKVFAKLFPSMSLQQRQTEWKSRRFIFDYAPSLAFTHSSVPSLIVDAYDAILISQDMDRYIQTCDSSAISQRWTDIQSALDPDEANIYYFGIDTDNRGKVYSALIICPEWDAPRMVRQIFVEQEFNTLSYDEVPYSEKVKTAEGRKEMIEEGRLGRRFWGKILEVLSPNTKTISYNTLPGIFQTFDPKTLYLDFEEPINGKYRFK